MSKVYTATVNMQNRAGGMRPFMEIYSQGTSGYKMESGNTSAEGKSHSYQSFASTEDRNSQIK